MIIAFRMLSIVHMAIGVISLPAAAIFGVLLVPVLILGPVWMIVLGVRLWKPNPRVVRLLQWTHAISLAVAAMLVWYGIVALQAAERSAAAGGGLLGGFGLLPLGLGILIGMVAVFSLLLASRGPKAGHAA